MRALNIIVAITLISCVTRAAHARAFEHWGVRAGYTGAEQQWTHDFISESDLSMRSGFHIGVFSEWFDYHNLSLQASMTIEQKGVTMQVSERAVFLPGGASQDFGSTLSYYLSFPILVKYTFGSQGLSPYLMAGPRIDVFLGYVKNEDHFAWGIEDEWDQVVFGLSGGVGLIHRFGRQAVFIEFVYNYDPYPIIEFTNGLTGNTQSMTNRSFNISLGVRVW